MKVITKRSRNDSERVKIQFKSSRTQFQVIHCNPVKLVAHDAI